MYRQIASILEEYGYQKVKLNVHGIHMALRQEREHGYVVVTIDETKGDRLTRDQFFHIAEQIRDFLRKRDCFYSHFLYLLVSDEEESTHRLFQGQECFWRIVPAKQQLMVYETSDEAFMALRRPLERLFPGSAQQYSQNASYEQSAYNRQAGNGNMSGGSKTNMFGQWILVERIPWCNIILIALNVIIFLYTDLFAFTGNDEIVDAGALSWVAVMEQGQWYRVITSMFLHSNLEHIFNNMLTLGYVGSCLENKIGSIRYAILYLGSGILAGCASMGYNMMQNANVVSIGASGAIFGVIGAMLFVVLAGRRSENNYTVRQIAVMAALSLYGGLTSQGVDNAAHFGGFLAGFILAGVLTMLQKRRASY